VREDKMDLKEMIFEKIKHINPYLLEMFMVSLVRMGRTEYIDRIRNPIFLADAYVALGEFEKARRLKSQILKIGKNMFASFGRSVMISLDIIGASKIVKSLVDEISNTSIRSKILDELQQVVAYLNSRSLYEIYRDYLFYREYDVTRLDILDETYYLDIPSGLDMITFRYSIDRVSDLCIKDIESMVNKEIPQYAKIALKSILMVYYKNKNRELADRYAGEIFLWTKKKRKKLHEKFFIPTIFKNLYIYGQKQKAWEVFNAVEEMLDDCMELLLPEIGTYSPDRVIKREFNIFLLTKPILATFYAISRSRRFKAGKRIIDLCQKFVEVLEHKLFAGLMIRFLARMKKYHESIEELETLYRIVVYPELEYFTFDLGTIYVLPYTEPLRQKIYQIIQKIKDPNAIRSFVYGTYDESIKAYPKDM